jgi:predicted RNA binding protein YcfA (HicA-like mRNA interferase family)
MRPLKGKELARIVERKGWVLNRVTGSHFIYKKSGTDTVPSIPIHSNKELRRGTQAELVRLAELTEEDLK